jgi:feruloyl esterase
MICHSRGSLVFVTAFLVISFFVGAAAWASPAGTPCEKLKDLAIPNVTITAAAAVLAGQFTPPGAEKPMQVPAFCRVEGKASPTNDSSILFEVWMPSDNWNGKFEGVGNGGYAGSISYPAMATVLRLGYATASTDTGHSGNNVTFADGHPEKMVDWAYRSIHVTAEVSKLIVRDYEGRFPDHAYFQGCSTGGQQALSEAQRYPEDYDGIIAGDPAWDRLRQISGYLWSWMATHDDNGASLFTAAKMKFVTQSAVAACDAIDGVKDGLIGDPRRCHFDPSTLACKGAETDTCLTTPQVNALKKVYAGTHNPRTGEEIFPGWSVGSEGFGDSPSTGWGAYILNPKEPQRIEAYRLFVFRDPNWDWRSFDFDKDEAYTELVFGYLGAVNYDLSGYKARGGKLVMYTGWADPVAAPMDVLKYYENATKTMGGAEKTQEFYRFFMAPGMGHCGGGPGPNTFDVQSALEDWVEHGKAPEKIIASHITDGKTDRTRPLCPYPQVAKWKGTGSTDDAANFVCAISTATSPTSASVQTSQPGVTQKK